MWYWALSPGLMTTSYRGTIRDVPTIASNLDFTDVLSPLSPDATNGTYRAPSGATLLAKSEFWKSSTVGPYRICRSSSGVPLDELPMSKEPKFPGLLFVSEYSITSFTPSGPGTADPSGRIVQLSWVPIVLPSTPVRVCPVAAK